MSCDVGSRCGSDLVMLWLWCRLAAVALIRPLAWELPYALSVALEEKVYVLKMFLVCTIDDAYIELLPNLNISGKISFFLTILKH